MLMTGDFYVLQPDYDDTLEEEPRIKPFFNSSRKSSKDKQQAKDRKYGKQDFWSVQYCTWL